ncbi:RsiV family protein [uncultured Aquimarina sp.]|uniref:RsiV family protein n=1 Tax=uncultured Aquimarina sp. TaxID=575652 RepID=UPI002625C7E1|nr:RsiV family protein [uncultured Aquimarina sp.]
MKKIIYTFLAISFMSCNIVNDHNRHGAIDQSIQKQHSSSNFALSNSSSQSDVKGNSYLDNFISTKSFYREENSLILDYKYPFLSEEYNPLFGSFNSFIEENYLLSEQSVSEILQNNDLSCDSLYENVKRSRRNIDYKLYAKNDQFLSILLYKTNYYDSEHHNSFMFKGLNYDIKKGRFITYEDLFTSTSEKVLLFKLNQELEARIEGQDSFNDCWKLTHDKFELFRNNFVMNSESIKFYFDDCTVCPTYSGNYFLEIPLEELSLVLKTEDSEMSYFRF